MPCSLPALSTTGTPFWMKHIAMPPPIKPAPKIPIFFNGAGFSSMPGTWIRARNPSIAAAWPHHFIGRKGSKDLEKSCEIHGERLDTLAKWSPSVLLCQPLGEEEVPQRLVAANHRTARFAALPQRKRLMFQPFSARAHPKLQRLIGPRPTLDSTEKTNCVNCSCSTCRPSRKLLPLQAASKHLMMALGAIISGAAFTAVFRPCSRPPAATMNLEDAPRKGQETLKRPGFHDIFGPRSTFSSHSCKAEAPVGLRNLPLGDGIGRVGQRELGRLLHDVLLGHEVDDAVPEPRSRRKRPIRLETSTCSP